MMRRRGICQYKVFASGAQLITLVVLAGCAGAAAANPDYPFSGRWREDTTSITGDTKPTVFKVRDGRFKRDDNPSITADGRPHPVADDVYVDEQTISIDSDHLVKEIDKIRGKLAYTVDYSVSPDGNSLTSHVASYTSPDGKAVRSVTVKRRVGSAKNGAHLLSGTWKLISVVVDSKHDWILKLEGNRFSQRTDGGSGFDAIIGGPLVTLDGDNSGVRAQITRPRPDLIVETDFSAKGTVDDTFSMQLMPDGKTIRVTGTYGPDKRPTAFTMHKQVD
ncbi:hypothetical protein [Sphingomonas sp. UYP23]